jgi:hypothetical protein
MRSLEVYDPRHTPGWRWARRIASMALCEAEARSLPRLLNVGCRTVHLVGVALLVGGVAWNVDPGRLAPALWLTLASGAALLGLEIATGGSWLLEARGLLITSKLGLLLLLPWAEQWRAELLIVVAVIASVGAHAPRWIRHASPGLRGTRP